MVGGSLGDRKLLVRSVAALATLQDRLGHMQDDAASISVTNEAADSYLLEGPMRARADALIQGWIAGTTFSMSNPKKDPDRLLRECRVLLEKLLG